MASKASSMPAIQNKQFTGTIGLENLDPRLIVSLSSEDKGSIGVLILDAIMSLAEKVTLSVPAATMSQKGGVITDIRSVQLFKGKDGKRMVAAEIAGPINQQAILLVQAVAKAMQKYKVASAFFPVSRSAEKSGFMYGDMYQSESFRPIFSADVQNLRVLEDGENLLFTTGKDIRTIHESDICEKLWEKHSKVLYSGGKEIAFIGRFQNSKTHVTFKGGEVYAFKLGPHSFQKLNGSVSTGITSAFLGLVEKGISAAIGMKKGSGESILTLIPQSQMPPAAA